VRGSTPAATARRIGARLTPLERVRGDLSRSLTRAIDLALVPEPEQRGTLEDLRLALEEALDNPSPPARRRIVQRRPVTVLEDSPEQEIPPASSRRLTLPRALWLGCALAAIVWQAFLGRPGVALLVLAAAAPLLALPRRSGGGWLAAALAPMLGLAGLAGAFPALAGQRARLSERAALAALGYWWLTLAEPLLHRHLWLGPHAGAPARSVWEGSLSSAAVHVLAPAMSLGVLLGASLWALAAVLLPFLVRGRSVVLDLVAATAWSIALVLVVSSRHDGLAAYVSSASPRGAILGGLFGGALAVAARALRGPV
jgi:hypothetical protein